MYLDKPALANTSCCLLQAPISTPQAARSRNENFSLIQPETELWAISYEELVIIHILGGKGVLGVG